MLKHFTGTHEHRIDGKGRVSLPSDFRRVLDAVGSSESLYIVPGLTDPRCHVVLPVDAYSSLIAWHKTKEYSSPAQRKRAAMMIMNQVKPVQVDDAGRIVISQALREQIGLTDQVCFVGNDTSFEIWSPDARSDYADELERDTADEPIDFDLRGLP